MKIILTVFILNLFISSAMSQSKYDTLYIANHKVSCVGVAPQECFLIKNAEAENWKYHYNDIKGFEFIPGNEYIIEVEKLYVATQAADDASFYYNLINILKTEPTMVISDTDRVKLDKISYIMKGMKTEENFDRESDFSKVYIYFDLDENRVNGRDGCNSINGKIKIDSGKIKFLPMMTTKMMCENVNVFSSFHKNINKVNNFKTDGDKLLFFTDEELLMEFEVQN
ncbi:MAG: DUF4377 domain-containing protein [Ignavibacteria bacterium]